METTSPAFRHTLPLQLRFNDIDLLGHVNNSVYFFFLRLGESPLFRDRKSSEYRLEESRCRCRQRQCRFPIAHLPG